MPIIGVPREVSDGERRVALTADAIRRLSSQPLEFVVEAGAGDAAGVSDQAYREVGASVADSARDVFERADILVKVAPPTAGPDGTHEADLLRSGAVLASFLQPHGNAELLGRLAANGITALSLELVPRITRAQSMDALSSQANLAGYKAAVLGAAALGKVFPLLMTAAGTLQPARVLVLGAGVAGLQAIATARRLGAEVWGYDIRDAVKEQVQSLGARFVELEVASDDAETAAGYARELAEDEAERRRSLLGEHIARADVVITTALVPGRPAPLLITAGMVEAMRPGSVIVDLAGEMGGNCELSEPGGATTRHGVEIHAPLDLPSTLATHASQMLARNLSALITPMIGESGVTVDLEDEVLDACCVTHDGEVRFGA